MTTNPPHERQVRLILPIAPNGNHGLGTSSDEKLPPALRAEEAALWLDVLKESGREIEAVECCGPGDVFASWPATLSCLELLRARLQNAEINLTCLGLNVLETAADLKRIKVSKVTLLVDAVTEESALALYKWIRPGRKTLPLAEAVMLLLDEQAETVRGLAVAGIRVAIRSTVQQGINDHEIVAIAEKMAGLGAVEMEINGSAEWLSQTSLFLKTSIFSETTALRPPGLPGSCDSLLAPKPGKDRPNVAVASASGMEVDLHLGQAAKLLIYGPRDDDGLACLLESRDMPLSGAADRWKSLAESLSDCFCLLASHAGDAPREQLEEQGIKVLLTDDQIEGLVDVLYGGGKKGKCKKK
jgi:nitrogen fixation protein NifB